MFQYDEIPRTSVSFLQEQLEQTIYYIKITFL